MAVSHLPKWIESAFVVKIILVGKQADVQGGIKDSAALNIFVLCTHSYFTMKTILNKERKERTVVE